MNNDPKVIRAELELAEARVELQHMHRHITFQKSLIDAWFDTMKNQVKEITTLRTRVGWLDHLDTPQGRALHATEAVRVENEQLRVDLRDAMELLRAHGQAPSWLLSAGRFGAVKDWNRRYGELLAKHKETP